MKSTIIALFVGVLFSLSSKAQMPPSELQSREIKHTPSTMLRVAEQADGKKLLFTFSQRCCNSQYVEMSLFNPKTSQYTENVQNVSVGSDAPGDFLKNNEYFDVNDQLLVLVGKRYRKELSDPMFNVYIYDIAQNPQKIKLELGEPALVFGNYTSRLATPYLVGKDRIVFRELTKFPTPNPDKGVVEEVYHVGKISRVNGAFKITDFKTFGKSEYLSAIAIDKSPTSHRVLQFYKARNSWELATGPNVIDLEKVESHKGYYDQDTDVYHYVFNRNSPDYRYFFDDKNGSKFSASGRYLLSKSYVNSWTQPSTPAITLYDFDQNKFIRLNEVSNEADKVLSDDLNNYHLVGFSGKDKYVVLLNTSQGQFFTIELKTGKVQTLATNFSKYINYTDPKFPYIDPAYNLARMRFAIDANSQTLAVSVGNTQAGSEMFVMNLDSQKVFTKTLSQEERSVLSLNFGSRSGDLIVADELRYFYLPVVWK